MTTEIKKITQEEVDKLIAGVGEFGEKLAEPRGLFYYMYKDSDGCRRYVGIDNMDGHCWVEDFKTLATCKKWLTGGAA